jgi:hypothetical protein
LKVLKALLGKTHRDKPAKKPRPVVVAKPATVGSDYRAVSVAPSDSCCAAANAIAGKRYLVREVPRLPLVDCTMAPNCSCKFKKVSDRRDRDRRQNGAAETNRQFTGPENRKREARRAAKT